MHLTPFRPLQGSMPQSEGAAKGASSSSSEDEFVYPSNGSKRKRHADTKNRSLLPELQKGWGPLIRRLAQPRRFLRLLVPVVPHARLFVLHRHPRGLPLVSRFGCNLVVRLRCCSPWLGPPPQGQCPAKATMRKRHWQRSRGNNTAYSASIGACEMISPCLKSFFGVPHSNETCL